MNKLVFARAVWLFACAPSFYVTLATPCSILVLLGELDAGTVSTSTMDFWYIFDFVTHMADGAKGIHAVRGAGHHSHA